MVIAVPVLAERQEADEADVVALHARRHRRPSPDGRGGATKWPTSQCPRQRYRDADRYRPRRPSSSRPARRTGSPKAAAAPSRCARGRRRTGRASTSGSMPEFRRMVERNAAMHLPPGIVQQPAAMSVEIVAGRLALRPVANVVRRDHAERCLPCPTSVPEIDERDASSQRGVGKAAMDQQPVHPTEWPAQMVTAVVTRNRASGIETEGQRPEDQGLERSVPTGPDRSPRRPDNAASDWVAPRE